MACNRYSFEPENGVQKLSVRGAGCRALLSKGRTAAQSSLIDLHIDAADDTIRPGHQDIEARLRTLERLKSDGLITGEEYRAKREQILQEKW